eukprot:CAMPEP_0119417874 /NCGR_PEP_ID=MMETSP1335-20130426/16887_1 /TAXON_ID=259385 /ORGANISM="Chrysoculter rhomboideus, Strain RCC1486" /LENGTH=49 /DNA_ID= /DNA_START= /DNA_END= /DNA_ORIENTATION=
MNCNSTYWQVHIAANCSPYHPQKQDFAQVLAQKRSLNNRGPARSSSMGV